MVKPVLSSIIIIAMALTINGQYLPNAGFEKWETIKLFDEPVYWNSGNTETYTQGLNCVMKTTDSYSGTYALKLISDNANGETLFGYAFCNGMLAEQEISDTPRYSGGFPVSSAPDSLHGYFKYHVAENDTAIGMLSFKKDGVIVGQDLIRITGSSDKFVKLDFDVDPTMIPPDTAMIAFSCTNPFGEPIAGNWLIIDSLWFEGSTDTIPNADFEKWIEIKFEDPIDWASLNELTVTSSQLSATKTTDKYSGDFAIRIESKVTINPFGNPDTITTGILIPQPNGGSIINGQSVFDIDINPSELTGYYKFIPTGNDIAGLAIKIIDADSQIYNFGITLMPASSYTKFSAPLSYPIGTVVRQIYIAFTTNYLNQGLTGQVGSILYIDDLELIDPCKGKPELVIENITEDPCIPQTIDAGDGWDIYSWSTGDTSQTITITDIDNYSVIVTDNSTGCSMMDTIYIGQAICDGVEEFITLKPSINIYPVPTNNIANMDFTNLIPGNYNIEITAITGSIVKNLIISVSNSSQVLQIPVSDLTSGLYLLRINGNNFSEIKKLRIK